MNKLSIDLTGVKGVIASILIVVSLIVSVLTAVQGALPPKLEMLGTSNFDSITLSGDLNAANVTATTITATTLVSQSVGFAGTTATLSGAVSAGSADIGGGYGSTGCSLSAAGGLDCNGNVNIDGTAAITGNITAGTVYVNGYLRSSNGPVTAFDPFTALKEFTATKGIIINGNTYTVTSPITITGVLSNVRLIYYQVP